VLFITDEVPLEQLGSLKFPFAIKVVVCGFSCGLSVQVLFLVEELAPLSMMLLIVLKRRLLRHTGYLSVVLLRLASASTSILSAQPNLLYN
jgi:hypothetical protein